MFQRRFQCGPTKQKTSIFQNALARPSDSRAKAHRPFRRKPDVLQMQAPETSSDVKALVRVLLVNSAFVTGLGETKFTGPRVEVSAIKNFSALTTSASAIQLIHCSAIADPAADTHPKRRQHFRQSASFCVENDAETRVNRANSLLRLRAALLLPSRRTRRAKSPSPAGSFPFKSSSPRSP